MTKKANRCDGSGARTPLTVAEESARLTHCRYCERALKVRPVREEGNAVATIPSHYPPKDKTS